MAKIGFRKPMIGVYDEETAKYSTPYALGKGISVTVTPSYAEGTLYGDDGIAEDDKEFKYADITLGTTTIPVQAAVDMFGHTKDDDGEITYNKDDENQFVGIGFIGQEKVDGVTSYTALFCVKAKFDDPGDDFETKGESISYKTPSITGKAYALDDGNWKKSKSFKTAAEATAWVNTQFGVTGE